MNLPLPLEGTGLGIVLARTQAVHAIEKRFGWLRAELYQLGGNVSALEPHKQLLWMGREKAIARLNRISRFPDKEKRERAYRKLARDLKQRIASR